MEKLNLPKHPNKKGIWKDKLNVYKVLFDALSERFDINEPNEIMLLDLAVNDYIRIKRLHLTLKSESDIVTITTRMGQKVRKAHEAGYLINAIESQFRQNMKELLLTPRESLKKTIGEKPKDFTDAIGRIVEGDYTEVDNDGDVQPRVPKTEGKKTKTGDTTGGSEHSDRKDGKTTGDIK